MNGSHVLVQIVAQEREPDTSGAHVFLGFPVVSGKREGGIRGGACEGEVYDPLDLSLNRRVHGVFVLLHSVESLAG